MLDGDGDDISGIAVTAFAKESGLSNELARESLTTLRDGLQNQANQEVVDAGVDDVAKFYGGMAPSLRREIASRYAYGDNGPLLKAVRLHQAGGV